jgi:hypothetical protein
MTDRPSTATPKPGRDERVQDNRAYQKRLLLDDIGSKWASSPPRSSPTSGQMTNC